MPTTIFYYLKKIKYQQMLTTIILKNIKKVINLRIINLSFSQCIANAIIHLKFKLQKFSSQP